MLSSFEKGKYTISRRIVGSIDHCALQNRKSLYIFCVRNKLKSDMSVAVFWHFFGSNYFLVTVLAIVDTWGDTSPFFTTHVGGILLSGFRQMLCQPHF